MRITFFSDTHGYHGLIPGNYEQFKGSDVVVFCGDFSKGRGTIQGMHDFLHWYQLMPVKHRIFIAGNHDFPIQNMDPDELKELFNKDGLSTYMHYPNIIHLNDSGVEIDGIKFWGSPVTPEFHNWAFNRERGKEIDKHWQLIPNDTDVLITHGPVYQILDRVNNDHHTDRHVGCKDLRRHVIERIKPQIFACGHIHEQNGVVCEGETTFVNATMLDENYRLIHSPITIEIQSNKDKHED